MCCAAGAIYTNDTSNVTVLDSVFTGNSGGQGGAISLWNSSVLVNGTTFYRNKGNSAGAAPINFAGSCIKQSRVWQGRLLRRGNTCNSHIYTVSQQADAPAGAAGSATLDRDAVLAK